MDRGAMHYKWSKKYRDFNIVTTEKACDGILMSCEGIFRSCERILLRYDGILCQYDGIDSWVLSLKIQRGSFDSCNAGIRYSCDGICHSCDGMNIYFL